jgi:5-methylcytosine-specific restriction endonuclease McrA
MNNSWGKDTKFYKSKAWKNLRNQKINDNPLCELCLQHSIINEAKYVDHILNRLIFPDFELEYDNLQSLCPTCHSQKTQLERTIKDPALYLKSMQDGKLQYICTPEAKKRLFDLLTKST